MSFGGMLTGGDEKKEEPKTEEAKIEVQKELNKEEDAKIVAENTNLNNN